MNQINQIMDHLMLTPDGRGSLIVVTFLMGLICMVITDIIKSKIRIKRLREEGYNL